MTALEATHLYNLEAEYSLLGTIMGQNDLLEHIPFLEEDHFHSLPHRRIFAAIQRCVREGKLANALTLKAEFSNDQDLAHAGGATYLAGAMAAAVNVIYPVELAQAVVNLAQRRALAQACEETASALGSIDDSSPAEVAVALAARFEAISRGFAAPDLKDDFQVTDEILKSLYHQSGPTPTGLSRLDAAMDGGLYPGKAYGFAARKKVGKTITASTISYHLNQAGVRHLFVCGEMSPQEIHQRNLARLVNCYPSAFRTAKGRDPAFQKEIADAAVRSNRCILYYNAPGLTFDALRRVVVTSALQRGIKGFILDYWQLVGGKGRNQSTTEHLDEVAQWIADTCRKYGIWAIVMAQINQEGNTRGGEGMRLAFDQVYHLKAMGEKEDISMPGRWLEMLDTRYTPWINVGTQYEPGLMLNEKGPYFEQV